jgi:hypothetical protein
VFIGGYGRSPRFMVLRIALIALFLLAVVVFKGNGTTFVALRIGYLALLGVLVVARVAYRRRRDALPPYVPKQTPTAPTSHLETPIAMPPPMVPPQGGSIEPTPGLTWGGLPPEGPPPGTPPL